MKRNSVERVGIIVNNHFLCSIGEIFWNLSSWCKNVVVDTCLSGNLEILAINYLDQSSTSMLNPSIHCLPYFGGTCDAPGSLVGSFSHNSLVLTRVLQSSRHFILPPTTIHIWTWSMEQEINWSPFFVTVILNDTN